MSTVRWLPGELIAATHAIDDAPVHATEVGTAPAALCGATVSRTWRVPSLDPPAPAYELIMFSSVACPACTEVLLESLARE